MVLRGHFRSSTPMARRSIYTVHPSVAMVRTWVDSFPVRTGRSVDDWIMLVRTDGPTTDAEQRAWLMSEHGLRADAAEWVIGVMSGSEAIDGDPEHYLEVAEAYVEQMFAGRKAGLRPLYERLLAAGLAAAPDVKACPCKTIVPLYRNHVFAEIKLSTQTRIDLGLALGRYTKKIPSFIIETGGTARKDRITHRIPITSLDAINADVERWLLVAYDLDA